MELVRKLKTTELIERANGTNKLIVCFSREEAMRVFNDAKRMNKKIHLPITFNDFIEGRYSKRNVESILIDNIDICLKNIGNVETITMR